jgi:biopolymer transport protein ExbB
VNSLGLDRIQTLWQLFLAGGFMMWPITIMSVIVVAFGIERFIALRRSRFVPRALRTELAAAAAARPFDPCLAYQACQRHGSVAATVTMAMLEKVGRPLPEIDRAIEVTKESEASRLYANIRPISLAVSVTPLLGLLGTVQGMIIAFYTTATLDAGANRAAELAQGIYVALITTFAGLCVAIPAAMLAHFLEGKILRGFRAVDAVVSIIVPALERYEHKGRLSVEQLTGKVPVQRRGGPPPVPAEVAAPASS